MKQGYPGMTAHKNISGTYHLSVADILQVV
ncbi:hypothetical protein ACOS71_25865, partial [Escherichia coli]